MYCKSNLVSFAPAELEGVNIPPTSKLLGLLRAFLSTADDFVPALLRSMDFLITSLGDGCLGANGLLCFLEDCFMRAQTLLF